MYLLYIQVKYRSHNQNQAPHLTQEMLKPIHPLSCRIPQAHRLKVKNCWQKMSSNHLIFHGLLPSYLGTYIFKKISDPPDFVSTTGKLTPSQSRMHTPCNVLMIPWTLLADRSSSVHWRLHLPHQKNCLSSRSLWTL